mmetsp:Transcript_18212/g.35774  ORF Transcript_18212/g.35774 Transcript_18212/m.35774 type:complete len:357 (-) Transcript_18212:370-1440(-)
MTSHGGARVARLLVWCDGESTVKSSFKLFTDVFGLKAAQEPAKRSSATWFALANEQYHAAVTDDVVSIEFASVDWISRARKTMKAPPAQQLLAICFKDVQEGVLEAAPQPTLTQSAGLLQQLAWIAHPSCHPMIFLDPTEATIDRAEAVREAKEDDQTHVKEIVFGEDEDRFYQTSSLLRSLATQSVMPSVISFGSSENYEDLVPVMRVLPASISSIVLRVPSLEPFRGLCSPEPTPTQSEGSQTPESSVQDDESTEKVHFMELATRGRSAEQMRVEAPFLSGLDLRLSASDVIDSGFIEMVQPTVSNVGSVTFDRDDMGSMSCTSVNAMEVRTRLNRLPKEVLRRLGNTMRPQIR